MSMQGELPLIACVDRIAAACMLKNELLHGTLLLPPCCCADNQPAV
jgi:hypothetical protein